MARIDFYHLQKSDLKEALPKLLEKVYQTGQKALIKTDSKERTKEICDWLWVYQPNSWLPHGMYKDGTEADQPFFITEQDENPNEAALLVQTCSTPLSLLKSFERVLNVFDGVDRQAIEDARALWKEAKEEGFDMHYFQQNLKGKWEEKIF